METVNITIPLPVLLKAIDELPMKQKETIAEKLNLEMFAEQVIKSKNRKRFSAIDLLKLPLNERNKILRKQAAMAKKLYEENPDLLLPDLSDDIIED